MLQMFDCVGTSPADFPKRPGGPGRDRRPRPQGAFFPGRRTARRRPRRDDQGISSRPEGRRRGLVKVVLAGYKSTRGARRGAPGRAARLDLTPETLSASYARISRDRPSVDELRRAGGPRWTRPRSKPDHSFSKWAIIRWPNTPSSIRRHGRSAAGHRGKSKNSAWCPTREIPALRHPGQRFVVPEEIARPGAGCFRRRGQGPERPYHRL